MRKYFLIVVLCATVYVHGFAQDRGIKFVKGLHWKDILAEANRTGKSVFVDCYATWCGPCRAMDNDVYNRVQVSVFFNKKFISVKMQMDTTSGDPEYMKMNYEDAHMLKERYEVNAFPTFLFFSPTGKILHRGFGYRDSTGLILLGKDAIDSNKQFYTLWDKYKARELSLEAMKTLASMAASLGNNALAHNVANNYIRLERPKEFWTEDNIDFMYQFTTSTRDPGFALFRDSAKRIGSLDKKMTEAACEGKDEQIIIGEVIKPLARSLDGKPDWKEIHTALLPYGPLGEKTLQIYMSALVFPSEIEPEMLKDPSWGTVLALIKEQKLGDNEKFLIARAIIFYEHQLNKGNSTVCKDFVEAFQYHCAQHPELNKAPQHNEIAWAVFQHDNDRRDLTLALGWSKYAIDSADAKDLGKVEYLDTYANLLYKLGRKDEAMIWEEKAIAMNPNPKNAEFEKNLQKMKTEKPTW